MAGNSTLMRRMKKKGIVEKYKIGSWGERERESGYRL